jgi:hypothetical protein
MVPRVKTRNSFTLPQVGTRKEELEFFETFRKAVFAWVYQQHQIKTFLQCLPQTAVSFPTDTPRAISMHSVAIFPGKSKGYPIVPEAIFHKKQLGPRTGDRPSLSEDLPNVIAFLQPLFPGEEQPLIRVRIQA